MKRMVSRRTVARKSSIGELCVCAEGGLTFKVDKVALIYNVSYFNLGGLGVLFGGM